MMTFISMRLAYIRRSISFVDRFSIQRSFYYFAHSIQLIDRYIELLLLLDPRPNLLAYTSFSTRRSHHGNWSIRKEGARVGRDNKGRLTFTLRDGNGRGASLFVPFNRCIYCCIFIAG